MLDALKGMALAEEPEEDGAGRASETESVDDDDLPAWAKRSAFEHDDLGASAAPPCMCVPHATDVSARAGRLHALLHALRVPPAERTAAHARVGAGAPSPGPMRALSLFPGPEKRKAMDVERDHRQGREPPNVHRDGKYWEAT